MHAISEYEAWASGPWILSSGQLNFECITCLINESVRKGIHIVQAVAAVFPYLCFGNKYHSWSNTEQRPDVLLRHLDGCKLDQFEASWHRGRFGCKVLVVWTDDAWKVESPEGISRLPDGCTGTLKSSRTLNIGRTICHYVRTDATLNSSKFLDTDGRPDGFSTLSRRKLLTDERLDS
jgi:hypothetical protein